MTEPGAHARYFLEIRYGGASLVDYGTGDGVDLKPGDMVYIDPSNDRIDIVPDVE